VEDCFGGDCFEGALAMTILEWARNDTVSEHSQRSISN